MTPNILTQPSSGLRYPRQEVAAGVLFFAAFVWLVASIVANVPAAPPTLLPLVPMAVAVVWWVVLEHLRHGAPRS